MSVNRLMQDAQLLQIGRAAIIWAQHSHAVGPAERDAGLAADPFDLGLQPTPVLTAFGEPAIVDDGRSHAARGCCEECIEDARMADTEHRDIGGLRQFCGIRIALPARYRGIIGVDRKYRTGKADAIEGGDQPSAYRRLVRCTDDSNRSWPKASVAAGRPYGQILGLAEPCFIPFERLAAAPLNP